MKPRCVLVIDDEPDIRDLACLSFEFTTNWKTLTAASGWEGIAIAIAQQPDVILLDAMMPGIDGVTTLKQLKADARTHSIPVIFLTASALEADRLRYAQAGANALLSKPFDPETLAQKITELMEWSS